MGFRINNNIAAMVANSNLNKNQNMLSTSIERLSSGLRINRGADDAAGLTISEKLRGQIRGLTRAVTNAQDGISLIQTAEGALNEDAAILNRLRELAIQSQEDALTSNDRLEIQKEVDQLVNEVDRIALTTEFNTKKLLDGSSSALVTTDSSSLKAYQTGDAGQLSAGDYKVRLDLAQSGVRQVQQSGIFALKTSGTKAGLSTRLQDIAAFYDNDGNDVLANPQDITIRGNGEKATVTISRDMTLAQFSAAIETKINTAIESGGLGLTGSTFALNTQTGQIIFESGKEGSSGEIALASTENMVRALSMQVTTESAAAAYKVSATQVGVTSPVTTSANTTSDKATGVLGGLDFGFKIPAQARVDGTVASTDSIFIGANNVIFTITDTNAGSSNASSASQSFAVTVTLTANRTFTLTSITNIVNDKITKGTVPTANQPAITASFSGYDLVLTSSHSGTSAIVSVNANQAATDILGLRTGATAGTAGGAALMAGTVNVGSGITIGATNLILRIADGDRNLVPASTIMFLSNTAISSVSLTTTINNALTANNIKARAQVNSSGSLELYSTETGTDARVSLTVQTGSGADIGFITGQNANGTSGNAAVMTGATQSSAKTTGYTFGGGMSFVVTDKNGRTSGTLNFYATGLTDNSNDFTLSKAQMTSIINASTIGTTDVSYSFDAGGRLDFASRSSGKDARIILSTVAGGASHVSTALNALGVNISQAVQGSGQSDFTVHVADRSVVFQIGANQSQQLKFSVINTSAAALGLKGLDLTNIKSATRALGSIDDAVQTISSERSKLGSLQNRMNSTINNLTVTATNLQSTESKIRDVDVAKETVEFTRNQILVQAGTAQLAQAKGLSQGALQLLQG